MSANNSSSAGNQAGQGLGDAVKGIFNTVGGAGEAIRGNFNDFVDRAGEGLASAGEDKESQERRQAQLNSSTSGTRPGENADVARKGMDQINQGINQLTGQGKSK
ncbi:unnamed protein product [Parajaminaea phylloscopi]